MQSCSPQLIPRHSESSAERAFVDLLGRVRRTRDSGFYGRVLGRRVGNASSGGLECRAQERGAAIQITARLTWRASSLGKRSLPLIAVLGDIAATSVRNSLGGVTAARLPPFVISPDEALLYRGEIRRYTNLPSKPCQDCRRLPSIPIGELNGPKIQLDNVELVGIQPSRLSRAVFHRWPRLIRDVTARRQSSIRTIANMLVATKREVDVAARAGGEELAAMFAGYHRRRHGRSGYARNCCKGRRLSMARNCR
jgi:hypothetical protein